jgi:hypothetical protein
MNQNYSQNFSQNFTQNLHQNHNHNYENLYLNSATSYPHQRILGEYTNFTSNMNNSYPQSSQLMQGSQESNFSQVIKNNFEQSFQKLPEKLSFTLMNKLRDNFSNNQKSLLSAKKLAEISQLSFKKNLEEIVNKIDCLKNKLQKIEKKINEITFEYEDFEQHCNKLSEIGKIANIENQEMNENINELMRSFLIQIETLSVVLEDNSSLEKFELKNILKILTDSFLDFKSNLDLNLLKINQEIIKNKEQEQNMNLFQEITILVSEVKKKMQFLTEKIFKKKRNVDIKEISKENFFFSYKSKNFENIESENPFKKIILNKNIQIKKKKIDISFY